MSGGLRYRKRLRMGPLPVFLNISRSASRGWTHSWSVRAFGVTRNLSRNRTTVDLPGGLYYEGKGKRGRTTRSTGRGRRATPRSPQPEPTVSEPYRPCRWPYAVLAVLTVLSVLGGATWQPVVLFGTIAVLLALVQWRRTVKHRPTPPEPAPIDYEAEARRAEEMGAPESAATWRRLGGIG